MVGTLTTIILGLSLGHQVETQELYLTNSTYTPNSRPAREEEQKPIKQFAARLDWLDTRRNYSNKNQTDFCNPENDKKKNIAGYL